MSQSNPWPCTRCGAPVVIHSKATRLSWAAAFALLLATLLVWMGASRWRAGAGWAPFAVALALVLVARLVTLSRARSVWHCTRCQAKSLARLHHAGPLRCAVLLPTYNNNGSIVQVMRRVAQTAPDLDVLVIDDGSTDNTGTLAQEAFAALRLSGEVLRHSKNQGKGAALTTGLRKAFERGFSHVIALDADGQHFPEDLPSVRAAIEQDPTAIWVGARDLTGENVQGSSRFGRAFSNFWLRVQTGVKLLDSQSGFRAYPTAPTLSLGTRARAYDFEVEVLTLGARAGMPLRSLPIRVHYPKVEERVSHFDKLWDNVRISWVNTRLLLAMPLWPLGWPAQLSKQAAPPAVLREWSGKSRGGAFGHLVFLVVLRALGRKPAYALLYPVALYFLLFARPAVRASCAFLDVAIGAEHNSWRRFWRSYKHMLTFAQCILDRAITQVSGKKGFTYTSEGHEHVSAFERGVLLLSAHLGNYEVGGTFLQMDGVPLNVVMFDAEARAVKAVHARMGADKYFPNIIAINKSEFPSLKVLTALRKGEGVALHGDRVIDNHWALCDFFGSKAAFPTGIFMMAAAAKAPVVLTFGFKTSPSHYYFVAEPPREIVVPREGREQALAEHAQWYASRVEAMARQYPYQWFNFYDFWKQPQRQQD